MLKLKKTAVAVLALGSSTVFAGTMGPVCAPGNVTIPCERTAWDFGAQALYLRPSYSSDIGYPIIYFNGASSTVTDTLPNWGWGFQIEGSYHFNTGNDLDVNWYHYRKSTNQSFLIGSNIGKTGESAGTIGVTPRWDAINLEFGQHIDFSDMKYIRIHAGGQFARIRSTINSTPISVLGVPYETGDSITYNGFGPRIGADMTYDIGNGLGIYGKGAFAVLVGSGKQAISGYIAPIAYYNLSTSRPSMVVPEVEGKLGVKYDYMIAQGDLGLDVGYMWVNYFNTVLHLDTASASQGTNINGANFALNGLYFGLKWTGNV